MFVFSDLKSPLYYCKGEVSKRNIIILCVECISDE